VTIPTREIDVRLITYPHYPDNPWQRIVHAAFAAEGREVVALTDLGNLPLPARASATTADVLHLNWTAGISQGAPDVATAFDSAQEAVGRLERFQAAGGRVVWTIHNVLPHELSYLLPEVWLCRRLAELADSVVIMNPLTLDLVADRYRIDPAKVVHIDHPSYLGVFPDETDVSRARAQFRLLPTDRVSTFVGVLRPYKGLDALVGAFDVLADRDPRQRLLVGGRPGAGYTPEDLDRLFAPRPHLHYRPGYIDDAEMQNWMRAADLVVLPYLHGLNVSVVMLAASFGIPVAVRRLRELRYLEGESWIAWIEGNDPVSLADSIEEAQHTLRARPTASADALSFARRSSPDAVSAQYRDVFCVAGRRRNQGVDV
jgi:beta-1,4-mannosyltransferase